MKCMHVNSSLVVSGCHKSMYGNERHLRSKRQVVERSTSDPEVAGSSRVYSVISDRNCRKQLPSVINLNYIVCD